MKNASLSIINSQVRLDDPDFAVRHGIARGATLTPAMQQHIRELTRSAYAKRVIEKLGRKNPEGLKKIMQREPTAMKYVLTGKNVAVSRVNGLGEVEQHMAGFLDVLSNIGGKVLEFGSNRYMAKKSAEDQLKLEAKQMNDALKRELAQTRAEGKSAEAIAIQQNEMAKIQKEITLARMPLYIGLTALGIGASAWVLKKFKGRR